MEQECKWWKEAVVYQIYPRSFCDSNGDGIGDLRGILSKLDYLKGLGVTVIWISPIYQSPNDDNGYDISDYYRIMNEFGTMADFDELLANAHKRDLKIVMDLVVNHTSDEHLWFQSARESKQSDKRDYYIWSPGKQGKEPNNWASFFTPSAWEYDDASGEYYLHLFSKKQPDLNWENQRVRNDIYTLMTWWLEKGIGGFRMDVINCISKTEGLPDIAPSDGGYEWAGSYFMNGPKVHEYLKEMNRKVLSQYDIMTVGETPEVTPADALRYAGTEENELNMVFQSELMDIDSEKSCKWETKTWHLTDFKRSVSKWQQALSEKAWNSIFLGNHDQPRMVSRFGNDTVYRVASAKMLATLLLTLQGTPYLFQGDEIGMTNTQFDSISDCRDIEAINYYQSALKNGINKTEIMNRIRRKCRDNARTPMQWNAAENAGFSCGTPWMAVNQNFRDINVENDLADADSIYNYDRRLIRLRHESPTLVYGTYRPLCENDERVMMYIRQMDDDCMLIILNFTDQSVTLKLPDEIKTENAKLLIGNLKESPYALKKEIGLEPYEALIFNL
jgi:oligo-1,6-glucosidase